MEKKKLIYYVECVVKINVIRIIEFAIYDMFVQQKIIKYI